MSKEQTPMEQEMLIHFNGKRGTYLNKAQIKEVSEFTKAKVLESLERAQEYCDEFAIKKIETEVKPKYK